MRASTPRNNFTSGEIWADAQDRVDIAQIGNGIDSGQNLTIQVTGGLKKRRGMWWLGSALAGPTAASRLIRFRKSATDALILEFGNLTAKVWQPNGSPLMSGGSPVTFATPYTTAQLPSLRYCQVQDVIYFFDATGATAPTALSRNGSNTAWSFDNPLTLKNGPWLPENDNDAFTITVSGGSYITDANPTGYGAVATQSGTVTLVASQALFTNAMIGSFMRIRVGTGNPSMRTWFAGYYIPVGWMITYDGNIYLCTATAGSTQQSSMSTPPVQDAPGESQNDGCNTFQFLHDGAGVVQITAVTDSEHATATVVTTLPIGAGQTTAAWSNCAWGGANGWPRAWPTVVEERLAAAGTVNNPDFIDLTRTAGFTPTYLDFHPGQGTGNVLDTDSLRERVGIDGGRVLWTYQTSFLMIGSESGEYVLSGGLFGEPLTPSSAVVRRRTAFGSADVQPQILEKGLAYVTVANNSVRMLDVDLQQNVDTQDYSFLAHHLELRGFAQLTWIKAPDRVLWSRMLDGGLAALTVYDEQQVRGWTSQALAIPAAGALSIIDMVAIPGPGGFDTLWMLVTGTLGGVAAQGLVMLSQVTDGLFMDLASLYSGAATTTISGLSYLNGESVTAVCNGVAIAPQTVTGGAITVPPGTTKALVGLTYPVSFQSLDVNEVMLGGTLGSRERITHATVDLLCVTCQVGQLGESLTQTVTSRPWAQMAAPTPTRTRQKVPLAGGASRQPRVTITEQSPYDFGIYLLRPDVVAEGFARG